MTHNEEKKSFKIKKQYRDFFNLQNVVNDITQK